MPEGWPLFAFAGWCFVLAWMLGRSDASRHALVPLIAEGLAILLWQTWRLAPPGDILFAFKLDGLGLNAAYVMMLTIAASLYLWPPRSRDLVALLLWASLLVIDYYSLIIERIGCNLLGNDLPWEVLQGSWAQDTAAGVCERLFGEAFVYVPLGIQIFASTIIVWAYLGWIPIPLRGRR